MKITKYWLPIFCLETGVVLGIIRGIQLQTGYETETMLPVSGNPLLAIMVVILLAFAVAVYFLAARKAPLKDRELDFVQYFRNNSTLHKTIGVICGVLLLAGGAAGLYLYTKQLYDTRQDYAARGLVIDGGLQTQNIPPYVFWILCLVTGVSIVGILAMQSKIELPKKDIAHWPVWPMLWAAFLLISCYLDDSSIPAVSLYAFLAFASLFMMLAYRDFAGFVYAYKKPVRRFLVTSSCAVVLVMMEVISRLWNFFLYANSMETTLTTALKLVMMTAGTVFLFCNQVTMLSNLNYQKSLTGDQIQVHEVPEEEEESQPASETAEEIVKEFTQQDSAETNSTTQE